MITDLLESTITNMTKTVKKESSATSLKDQDSLRDSFSIQLKKAEMSVNVLQYTITELNFKPTRSTIDNLKASLEYLKNSIDDKMLNLGNVKIAKQKHDVFSNFIAREWKTFHGRTTSAPVNTLKIISSISANPVEACIQTLQKCDKWPDDINELKRFKATLLNAEKLITEANLNPDVEAFLVKATKPGGVSFADLKPAVIEWINAQGLASRIRISL